MRLIDADRLYRFVQDQMEREVTGAYTRGLNKAYNIVKSALHNKDATPTIDAEVVTRCKDCKYFKIVNERLDGWGCSVLFDPYGRPLISLADDFCSYAEPKARDEE